MQFKGLSYRLRNLAFVNAHIRCYLMFLYSICAMSRVRDPDWLIRQLMGLMTKLTLFCFYSF